MEAITQRKFQELVRDLKLNSDKPRCASRVGAPCPPAPKCGGEGPKMQGVFRAECLAIVKIK
jgi:hypothetical protein